VTSSLLSTTVAKTNDAEFMQKLMSSKRPRLKGDNRDDELTARLTELWERNDTPSPGTVRAGAKRKSSGDLSLAARSVTATSETKQSNGMLSQMLLANNATATATTALSVNSVAVATPQMNMAKSVQSLRVRTSSSDFKSVTPVSCSTGLLPMASEQLISHIKFLSGGVSASDGSSRFTTEAVSVTSSSCYTAAVTQKYSNVHLNETNCSVSLDDEDVMSFLSDTPHATAATDAGSDDATAAFLQQLEQILSEATESEIDSVLNDCVIPSSSAPSAVATRRMSGTGLFGNNSSNVISASTSAEEQRAICKIQSQLMRETASIQPAPQQPKLLGLLLSEGSPSCSTEKQTAGKNLMTGPQRGQPLQQLPRSPSGYRLLNPSGMFSWKLLDKHLHCEV
jgi:uncharacterized protein YbbK (DUF523 family)